MTIAGLLVLFSSSVGQKAEQLLHPLLKRPIQLGRERTQVRPYVVNTLPGVLPIRAGERPAVSCDGQTRLLRESDEPHPERV